MLLGTELAAQVVTCYSEMRGLLCLSSYDGLRLGSSLHIRLRRGRVDKAERLARFEREVDLVIILAVVRFLDT